MMRTKPFALLFVISFITATSLPSVQAADTANEPLKPNVVLIFCDDLGYGDIGCFGSTNHRTPNVDRIAAEGRRFTNFYVTSGVCSPSRSSLMTGCYPRRVGIHENETGRGVLFPGNSRGLNPSEVTVAELLKQQGYRTGIVGKWHLGDQPEFLPTRQGFDEYFGIPYSNDMGQHYRPQIGYPPLPLMRNEEVIETEPDQTQLTSRYTKEAIRFITENRDRPFFLYLPHTFPHVPLFASERFRGKSANGAFGDAVEEVDWSTGEILNTLHKLNLDEKTLVIFTSDNGAAMQQDGSNLPLRGSKGSTWEGGMRVPCVMRYTGQIPADTECDALVASLDIMPTLVKLAGGTPPADRVIDGRDIWPLMTGQPGATTPHEAFFYYQMGYLEAVRSGKWKLHFSLRRAKDRKPENIVLELYDLDSDIGETNNVADQHPDVVKRLLALAEKCREDIGHGDQPGANARTPGHVDNAKPLTH